MIDESNIKLPKIRGSYRLNADLSKTNWFGVGGPAEILFRPKDIDDLVFFLKNRSDDLQITILGVGSNIIVKDGGIEGVVIKLGAEFAKINHENNIIKIGGGCLCSNVALYSKINGLGGLEFLTGIPGSIGGAMAMNAGCYDTDISKVLISALAVDFDGNLITLNNEDFGFKYRGNKLRKDLILLEGTFQSFVSTVFEVGAKIASFNKKREETQPIRSKTGGSTFKNPGHKKAWELIDEAGCRGMKNGDAQMSEKHCNFMINLGRAKAQDLIDPGNEVIHLVKEKTGVTLEWEIKIIGK
jgi:UDP-N-acetylmuramate dehydrogenase